MYAVLDSSTLISLAWAGQLSMVGLAPLDLVVPHEVWVETVEKGKDHGYPDAVAIDTVAAPIPRAPATGAGKPDEAVLIVAREHGTVLTNDLALGRRAANLGVRWLRTADLVVLCVRTGRLSSGEGIVVIRALHSAGRLTDELAVAYVEELEVER